MFSCTHFLVLLSFRPVFASGPCRGIGTPLCQDGASPRSFWRGVTRRASASSSSSSSVFFAGPCFLRVFERMSPCRLLCVHLCSRPFACVALWQQISVAILYVWGKPLVAPDSGNRFLLLLTTCVHLCSPLSTFVPLCVHLWLPVCPCVQLHLCVPCVRLCVHL